VRLKVERPLHGAPRHRLVEGHGDRGVDRHPIAGRFRRFNEGSPCLSDWRAPRRRRWCVRLRQRRVVAFQRWPDQRCGRRDGRGAKPKRDESSHKQPAAAPADTPPDARRPHSGLGVPPLKTCYRRIRNAGGPSTRKRR
jgi:hypothetical protein